MFGTVAILGTGLMGGSLAAALGARLPAVRRVGFGLEPDLSQALARGLFDAGASTVAGAVCEADLVVLAAPISVNCALMGEVVRNMRPDALLTDLSSVKGPVVEALRTAVAEGAAEGAFGERGGQGQRAEHGEGSERGAGAARPVADASGKGAYTGVGHAGAGMLARFVASHPIAGSEKSGPMAADPDLFVGREAVLSLLPGTAPETVARLEALWQRLGARVTRMSVAEHDRVFALVSHVPHAVAFGMAGVVALDGALMAGEMAGEGRVRAGDHAGPGLLDMTRIAASSPALWADILLQNREQTLVGLDGVSARLQALAQALQAGDRERLTALLAEGADWRREQG